MPPAFRLRQGFGGQVAGEAIRFLSPRRMPGSGKSRMPSFDGMTEHGMLRRRCLLAELIAIPLACEELAGWWGSSPRLRGEVRRGADTGSHGAFQPPPQPLVLEKTILMYCFFALQAARGGGGSATCIYLLEEVVVCS